MYSAQLTFQDGKLRPQRATDHGYWISIDREIYDVSGFLGRHPGGPTVLHGYAGGDATDAYHRLHSASAAAAVALDRCRIGVLSTPEVSSIADGSDPRSAACCFGTWADLPAAVVEMQNALRQDYSLRRGVGPAREAEEPRSPYLLERSVDTFERFVTNYLRPTADAAADLLWPVAAGGPDDPPSWMRQRVDGIWSSPPASAAVALPDHLRDRLHEVCQPGVALTPGPSWAMRRIDAECAQLEAASTSFLGELTLVLRDGILLLKHAVSGSQPVDAEQPVDAGTGQELVALARQIPGLLIRWLEQIADRQSWTSSEDPRPLRSGNA